jgi:hypothetical protein
MEFLHAFPRDVSVDLCGRYVAVAEQQLDNAKIGAIVQ